MSDAPKVPTAKAMAITYTIAFGIIALIVWVSNFGGPTFIETLLPVVMNILYVIGLVFFVIFGTVSLFNDEVRKSVVKPYREDRTLFKRIYSPSRFIIGMTINLLTILALANAGWTATLTMAILFIITVNVYRAIIKNMIKEGTKDLDDILEGVSERLE